jgi:hypothetical protein
MRWVLWVALAGCRINFDPQPVHQDDAPAMVSADAAVDGPPAAFCDPLTTVTVAQCNAAWASPATAADQVLFDCAADCHFGACGVYDPDCTGCACNDYVKSSVICDTNGICGAPISGTGCLGGNFYAAPPFNCPSSLGIPGEGACMIRYLKSIGDC